MPSLRLVAGSALLALVVTGCGSQSSSPSGASTKSSASPSGSPSSSVTPAAQPTTPAGATVQRLRARVHESGTGRFSQVTTTVPGKVLTSINGHYLLRDQQLAAGLRVAQGGNDATARVELVKDDAYLQAASWPAPSRSCWLRTTNDQLSRSYGVDVVTADLVPIPVQLLDDFVAVQAAGKGVIDGTVPITSVLPLLSDATKAQLVAEKPKGVLPAFLTFQGNALEITVPGYALSTALSQSLGIDASKLSSIAQTRLLAGLTVTGSAAAVQPPGTSKQMSTADLKANRCG